MAASLIFDPIDMDIALDQTETGILLQFFKDYLNRFEVYKMDFAFDKGDYSFAGQTRNLNTISWQEQTFGLRPLMDRIGIPEYISVGGDFVVGYDFGILEYPDAAIRREVGLSIFDIANHGYEAFFLAGHLRGILINTLDAHVRGNLRIENHLFSEINEMLKGPVTQSLVQSTNPARATRSKGAVGLHGQFHVDTGDFNFVCAGIPLFYFNRQEGLFYYLEPASGPPLGYFSNREVYYRPYVPHTVKIHPGDVLVLATDGCFDTEFALDKGLPVGLPTRKIRHYVYPENDSLEVMAGFDCRSAEPSSFSEINDPAIQTFCFLLERELIQDLSAREVVKNVLDSLGTIPFFGHDDKSLIVVQGRG